MTVKDDILSLKTAEEDIFSKENRYVQALPTEPVLSKEGDTVLSKPADETINVKFTPTDTSYKYRVDVWSRTVENQKSIHGFIITAEKDLGDGVIELVRYGEYE